MIKYIVYVIGAYLGTWLLVQLIANNIIYQPPKPSTYQDNPHILKIPMDVDTSLSAVYLPNTRAKYTILYFHGNAADLGAVHPILQYIHAHGYAVMSYDYPRYGTSTGGHSEAGMYRSAATVYDYMVDTLKVPPSTIIAYGQSLGAAVALDLALHKETRALVMESAFLTAFRAVFQLPLFPFDRFKNNDKIGRITTPVLLINGNRDVEIPSWQSNALYKLAPSPKQQYIVKGAGHNDIFKVAKDDFWRVLSTFLGENP